MRISQTLRKPANWQDFESLCLMLWREEWESDDLKKNGRIGQTQHGVDISGHKSGEDEYSGIQCKCKSDGEVLTADEVSAEIEKAKSFQPPLKRYIIATTAKKDASLEELIRLKDVENRKNGFFSIDVKSWEDIVDMLERHKKVLFAYQGLIEDDYLAVVTFGNNAAEMEINPRFRKVYYIKPLPSTLPNQDAPAISTSVSRISAMQTALQGAVITPFSNYGPKTQETNRSFVPIKIMITNEGTSPLDNLKLELHFDCQGIEFTYDNIEEKGGITMNSGIFAGINSNVDFEGQTVILQGKTLNPKDKLISDDFFIKVPYRASKVNVYWCLLSRHYHESGILSITVTPEFEETTKENEHHAGETWIEDCIDIKELD